VAQRVVDSLEAVEVEHQDVEWRSVPGEPGGYALDFILETGAVGQPGQGVVPRQIGDPGLGPLQLGDVLGGDDAAPGRQRVADRPDKAAIVQFGKVFEFAAQGHPCGDLETVGKIRVRTLFREVAFGNS
jgi:hypothetical protein